MATVGNVTTMVIKSTDVFGNTYDTTITSQSKRLYVNPNADYQDVDSIARALNNLTNNTYNDTELTTVVSVNEVLAG